MIKTLHHVGICVKNLEETIAVYNKILGKGPDRRRERTSPKLSIADYLTGGSALEFLQGAPETTQGQFVAARGEGLHHIALEVEDIEGELEKMAAAGVTLVNKTPHQGATGKGAFIGPQGSHGVIIELVAPDKKGKS